MKLKKAIPFILVGIVFGIAGTLLYQKWQQPEQARQAFASFAPDRPYCTYSFTAFEILQSEDQVHGKGEVKIANFAPAPVDVRDTLQRASFYTVPKRQSVNWRGKAQPTLAQIATVYKPYLRGAKLFRIEDLSRDFCNSHPPDPDTDLDPK